MTITNITPRETELQKQVIELAESLRNIGWEFELYKQGARNTHQKLLDEIHELKAKLAELQKSEPFAPDWADYRQGKDDALAEFSQEPVAWMNMSDEILPTFHRTKEAAAYWGDNPIPLYTKG